MNVNQSGNSLSFRDYIPAPIVPLSPPMAKLQSAFRSGHHAAQASHSPEEELDFNLMFIDDHFASDEPVNLLGLPRIPSEEFRGSGHYENKDENNLKHSIVRCDSSQAFELQQLVIRYQGGHKVRLANFAGSNIEVAVKKLYDSAAAEREVAFHKKCADCEHIVPLLDHAVVARINKETGEPRAKHYLFKEYSNCGDLKEFKAMLTKQLKSSGERIQYRQQLLNIALRQMIMAVVELHSKGLFHGNINLKSYFVSGNLMSLDALQQTLKVKLSNFSLTNDTQYTPQADIPRPNKETVAIYFPPEVYFADELEGGNIQIPEAHSSIDRVKQDSFSLGLTLLELTSSKEFVKHFAENLSCHQVEQANSVIDAAPPRGDSLVDVIRLLTHLNPSQRITPEEALQLPFFTEMDARMATEIAARTATGQRGNSEPLSRQTSFEPK